MKNNSRVLLPQFRVRFRILGAARSSRMELHTTSPRKLVYRLQGAKALRQKLAHKTSLAYRMGRPMQRKAPKTSQPIAIHSVLSSEGKTPGYGTTTPSAALQMKQPTNFHTYWALMTIMTETTFRTDTLQTHHNRRLVRTCAGGYKRPHQVLRAG